MQPEDIIKKEFSRSFLGYDMREVDVFLDEIIDRMEQMEGERKEMIAAMEYLLGKLENQGELPTIQAKYLKNSSVEKRLPEKRVTVTKEKRKKEEPEKKKTKQEKQEKREKRETPVSAVEPVQEPEKATEKRPPRKILQRQETPLYQTVRTEPSPEPVAIEMETMDSAPLPEQEARPLSATDRENAV